MAATETIESANYENIKTVEDGGSGTGAIHVIVDAGVAVGAAITVDDAAFTPAVDAVAMIGGFVDDTATDSVNEGDGGALRMTADRRLLTADAGPGWTSAFGIAGVAFTSADATTAVAVTSAPTAGMKLVITDIIASSDTAMFLLLQEETSTTLMAKVFLPANGTVQITPRGKLKLPVADKKLFVDASAAGNIAITAFYYSEP